MHALDVIERIRRTLWPVFGWTGYVTEAQYVGTIAGPIEAFERVLHHHGVIRNAPAYYKHQHDGGEQSAGSWVYLPGGYFGTYQDHLTLFADGRIYVHREYNWRRHPIKHLREERFDFPVQWWRSQLHTWRVSFDVEPDDPSDSHEP